MTLFPDAIDAMMGQSIMGRAQDRGYIKIAAHQIRDYTTNKQMQVDDYPYGGGRGAVMQADPLYRCWDHICQEAGHRVHTVYMSPCGRVFDQQVAKELKANYDHLILVCGHYEGVDQRFLDECVDEEISIGDFVLTGGEIPAMAVADCLCRMVPGVLPEESCYTDESHWNGLLEYPQYSRPEVWHGRAVRCCCPATTATWTTGGRRKATNAPCAAARTCSPNSTRASSPPSTTARSCSRPRRSCGRSRNPQRRPKHLTAQHNNAAIKCTPLSDSGVHFISSYGSLC